MRIVHDLDGCITDFVRGASERHKRWIKDWPPGVYDMQTVFGMSNAKFWKALEGVDFWNQLKWMPDGRDILHTCEDLVGQENICLCTSPTWDPYAAAGKMMWIQRELPDYARRFLIGPAKEFCADPLTILVDDADSNCKKFREAGGKAVLVPRPWNSRFKEQVTFNLQQELWFCINEQTIKEFA